MKQKKTPWIVDTKTSVEKTLLFEMKNNTKQAQQDQGVLWGVRRKHYKVPDPFKH